MIKNPILTDLIGGIQYVILSDEEARKRKTQKSILERKALPAFQVAIEINQQHWIIHQHIQKSVDLILRKDYFFVQTRELKSKKQIYISYKQFELSQLMVNPCSNLNWFLLDNTWKTMNCYNKMHSRLFDSKKFSIYNLSFSKNLMYEVFCNLENKFVFTNFVKKADIIIALKKHLKKNLKLKKLSKQYYIRIYILDQKNFYQIVRLFLTLN